MPSLPPKPDWDRARAYIASVPWVWAKTYAKTFPHWYTVRDKMPEFDAEFCWFAQFIRDQGDPKPFFKKVHVYLELDGWKYWTMGCPIYPAGHPHRGTEPETFIINRESIVEPR